MTTTLKAKACRLESAGILLAAALALAGCAGEASPPAEPASAEAPQPVAEPSTPTAQLPPQLLPDPPRVVATDPPNGARGVDPARNALTVTFDRAMDPQGWSWVQEDPATVPDLVGDPWFDPSGRVHTSQVRLMPGRTYVVWLNSADYQYFRDLTGIASTPFRWTFSTGGTPAGDSDPLAPLASHRLEPRVVELDPPDGARDVDPATDHLRVVFDRPMRDSWSWVTEDPTTFPETRGRPFFEADRRSHSLPVRLEPGRTYVIWLNSSRYRLFRSVDGEELPPQRWTFTTAPSR